MSQCIDCAPAAPDIDAWYDDLAAHCHDLFRSLPRSDQRRASEVYVSGLLRCPGKKSIRHIAREVSGGYSDQSLQQFVNQSNWNPAPVRRQLAGRLVERSAPTAWVVDEVAFRKHGRHSAGVERQYVGAQGRLSNCQLGVFVALAGPTESVPVTWRLTLPRSWDSDELRRAKAHIPPEERHQPYWRYQVDALDDLSGDWGVPLAPVVLDLRQSTSFTELAGELSDRGLQFVMQVNGTAPIRFHPGRGRSTDRRTPSFPVDGNLADLSNVLSTLPRRTLSWRDPHTDLLVRAQFSCAPVHAVAPTGGTGRPAAMPQVLLLEWGLGKRRPRAFWLSNMVEHDLEELVALTRLPGRVEADIGVMTDQLGLCDYEGRSFLGWHHHVTLVSVAYAFYLDNPKTPPLAPLSPDPDDPGPDPPPAAPHRPRPAKGPQP